MNIDRTLFWFKDGDDELISLSNDFFGLSVLLNRLLNERYVGKKIKFINIDFLTEKTYQLYPILPKESAYYYRGHLRYYGFFVRDIFFKLKRFEQNDFIWKSAYEYLLNSAILIDNKSLYEAAEYAYKKGLDVCLNTDYEVVASSFVVGEEIINASVWIIFQENGMCSKFILERKGIIVFEKELDRTKKGVEFFLDIYKAIVIDGNYIVVKVRKDADVLPFKILVSDVQTIISASF